MFRCVNVSSCVNIGATRMRMVSLGAQPLFGWGPQITGPLLGERKRITAFNCFKMRCKIIPIGFLLRIYFNKRWLHQVYVHGIFWMPLVNSQFFFLFFHVRTVRLDIIKVLFIHQLMHKWVVFKKQF